MGAAICIGSCSRNGLKMDKTFWQQRWQANEIGFHQGQVNPLLTRFWPQLAIAKRAQVLVPLCGKSHDLHWLAARGHSVLGVELSAVALQAFFNEQQLPVQRIAAGPFVRWEAQALCILEGDFFDLNAADLAAVQAVYDRAALIALPTAMRQRYAERLIALLPATAQQLLITLDYPQREMDGPPFAVSRAEVEHLYGSAYQITCLSEQDILAEMPGFQARGLTALREAAYHLQPR